MKQVAREGRRLGGREATSARIEGAYALAVGMPETPAPAGWTWRLLTDLARLESGHTPSRRRPDYWDGDIPWIGIKDATRNHGRTITETNENTNELGIANSAARILPTNTVCLSRTASVGYVVVMGRPMATSQDFVNWVCTDPLDYQFLKYVLIAEGDTLLRFASGSVHQTIYFPEVKSFHIALPPIDEQRAIVDLLSALDDKIELNRRMNETLGAMAQAIFRDWFVDFGPVRRKRAGATDPVEIMGNLTPDPARAAELAALFPEGFGGDGVPEGWSHERVIDQANWVNGAAYKKMHFVAPADGLPVIKIAELKAGVSSKTGFTNTDLGERYRIDDGELLFSWSGNPDTSIDTFIWSGGPAWLNQHIFAVRPNGSRTLGFLFAMLKYLNPEFAEIARDKQTTGLGHVTKEDLKRLRVAVPDVPIEAAFNSLMTPIFLKLQAAQLENRTLAETRDYLLPRLMSGEVRVDSSKVETNA